ncbi:nucleotidyltransferase [Syntrophomonas zehnderi]|nr:nucleotidyltransferase [Syntrophomonas zehnderi]
MVIFAKYAYDIRIPIKELVMAVLGIIAEFNPFHNGHLHLIQRAHQQEHFSATVIVMSGNFLQRGEAALCNKWSRTAMALKAGADLVIELPFCFAVRSAYYFARGAIQLLQRTGVVSHLAFGSESGNLEELQNLADYLVDESPAYQECLRKHLATGISFASARSLALQSLLPDPKLKHLLLMPNNILALEYLHVLAEEQSAIKPITIMRQGTGYHSTELGPLASASAIRSCLLDKADREYLVETMPLTSLHRLEHEILAGRAPISMNALEQSILLKLRCSSAQELAEIYEVTEGLENRILQGANLYGTLEELKHYIKSKRYSLARINRTLLYILLDVQARQIAAFDELGPNYLHILGFSTQGQKILQEIKDKTNLPVLNRGSNVKKLHQDKSDPLTQAMLDLDIRSTDIYTLLYPNPRERRGGQDFTTSPVRIP